MNAPLITLLTDFGIKDAYVAQMKGQMLSICPAARLVDISHEIPPQDIAYAALVLAQAVPYFPDGTVHLAVVDPGVGTQRRIIAAELTTQVAAGAAVRRQRCVLPDNGLVGRLAKQSQVLGVHEVSNSPFAGPRISATFHGRDIMGPVAAHWAAGASLAALGPRIDDMQTGAWPEPQVNGPNLIGEVIAIDHFGNVISNLPSATLQRCQTDNIEVILGTRRIEFQLVKTYGQRAQGASVILAGSHEMVELAVVGGNAAERFNLQRGEPVTVRVG